MSWQIGGDIAHERLYGWAGYDAAEKKGVLP